jgi:hypothetical protein
LLFCGFNLKNLALSKAFRFDDALLNIELVLPDAENRKLCGSTGLNRLKKRPFLSN